MKRKTITFTVVAAGAFLACGRMSDAEPREIMYVDASAQPPGDGETWDTAWTDLRYAIDQIWAQSEPRTTIELRVAKGTYKPAASDCENPDRSATFHLINGLWIRGGYWGIEGGEFADFQEFETILSGDLCGDDVPYDLHTNRTDNCYSVVTAGQPDDSTSPPYGSHTDQDAKIDHFTIYGGYNDLTTSDEGSGRGGGLFCPPGSWPRVTRCTFSRNVAAGTNGQGGGMYMAADDADIFSLIDHCTFAENEAENEGGGLYNGGNADGSHGSSPVIKACWFHHNVSYSKGAGMFNGRSCNPRLERDPETADDCLFQLNFTYASGLSDDLGGAGMYNDRGSPKLRGCTFDRNFADDYGNGGGILS